MSTKYKIPDEQLNLFAPAIPSMPVFDTSRCQARVINYETAARMVETYHYAHRVPPMVITLGLLIDNELAGVCAYSALLGPVAKAICGGIYKDNTLELTRLYTYDWTSKNSESFLIGQSFKYIKKNFPKINILLSYSDTKQNHIGTIYQATNWLYTGISKGSNEFQLPNGKILTRRTRHLTRNLDGRNTLKWQEIQELYPGIKKLQSSDKHRYVYFLGSKSQRKQLRKALKWPVLPYPKENVT